MSKRLKTSKDKIILTVFILLACVIYGLPHIIMSAKLGKNYTPFSLSPNSPIASDETYGYAGSVNHIFKGNFLLKEAYVKEYANHPTPLIADNLPSVIYALLAKLTGSLERSFITADFIFPPIIFLMLYIFTRKFINNSYFAFSVSFLTVIARDFISVIPYPLATFRYLTFADYQNSLLYLSRGPHPQFSFIIFLASMWSLVNLTGETKKRNIILTGVLFGLLFYTYMFYYSYFSLLFVTMIIFYLAKRNFDVVKKVVLSGLVAGVVASYYFYNVIKFYSLPIAQDFIEKMSLPYLYLNLTLLRYVAILIFFYLSTRKKDNKFYNLCLVILTGIIIIPLFKLIIGKDPTTFHFVRFALMPFATVMFFIALYNFLNIYRRLTILLSIILIAISLYIGFKTQIIATQKIAPFHQINDQRQMVFDWINQNTTKDQVIGSLNDDFNHLISVYTKNWTYMPYASRTIMPTYEGAQRYIILSNLLGITPASQKKRLDQEISYLFRYRTYDKNNNLDIHSSARNWTEDQINKLSANNWKNLAKQYNLNYIVVTPDEIKSIKPQLRFLRPITSINGYLIFKTI